jgi:hypothetical protein
MGLLMFEYIQHYHSFTDFENGSVFKPAELHLVNVNAMLVQVNAWSGA